MTSRLLGQALLAGALILAAQITTAGAILSPTAVVGNTMGTAPGGGSTANLINQTGLSSGFASGVTDFSTYIATNPTHATLSALNAWASSSGTTSGDLDFDLGDVYALNSLAFWTQSNSNAINSFTVFSALDATFSSAQNLGTFSASILNPISAQTFATPSTAQFVRLRVNSVHGGINVNIGEVAFDVDAAVPAPAPLALLGLGLAGLGFQRRKRVKAA